MRIALVFTALVFSFTTLAATTLQFMSGDYKVTATLDLSTMSVQADTQTHGTCMGSFILDLPNGKLTINLNAINGCEMESAVVFINNAEFSALMAGTVMNLFFQSGMFPDMRTATVHIVPTPLQ